MLDMLPELHVIFDVASIIRAGGGFLIKSYDNYIGRSQEERSPFAWATSKRDMGVIARRLRNAYLSSERVQTNYARWRIRRRLWSTLRTEARKATRFK